MKTSLLLALLTLSFLGSTAQSQTNGWLASFNTIKTGKKTSLHVDVQWRSADQLHYTQTFLSRAGLNYHINKKLTLTAGYAFIHNYRNISGADGYLNEHRIWQQLLVNQRIGSINIAHRIRLEQRFLPQATVENNELKRTGSIYANRFRYFSRALLPFKTESGAMSDVPFSKGFFVAAQDEVFLNIGNKENVNGKTFDQNRLYFAVGYRLNKSFDMEAGYMNQYINGRSADVNNHIIQLASYLRL